MATATRAEYYTAEEYAAAKEVNIAAFLQSIGYELTRSGHCYKGKIHDSLAIRDDGRWYWNSRGLHGYSPIELYKQILLHDYGYGDEITAAIAAVKALANGRGTYVAPVPVRASEPAPRAPDEPLPLPAPYKDSRRVLAYLCRARGLDPDIVRGLMKYGKIYETIRRWDKETGRYVDSIHHNAVFVAYDSAGRPQNAFLRGTIPGAEKPFKRDIDGSNKSYPFTLYGRERSGRVFVFESAIDAISHASLCKANGGDWRNGHRISLGGTSFLGLERFLSEHPEVEEIVSCLDNDATGERRSRKLAEEYRAKGYGVEREAPTLKDFNEDLPAYRQEETEEDLEL
ncbi:MAG: DUF3991 and toprim domain-containing protein [Clostridiales Family XIII bacterium]|jgi:hypothetical protein|nr:DUF3991 and toprim domain-containing protein [Clostridiales Family XIII bacterium]